MTTTINKGDYFTISFDVDIEDDFIDRYVVKGYFNLTSDPINNFFCVDSVDIYEVYINGDQIQLSNIDEKLKNRIVKELEFKI